MYHMQGVEDGYVLGRGMIGDYYGVVSARSIQNYHLASLACRNPCYLLPPGRHVMSYYTKPIEFSHFMEGSSHFAKWSGS